MNKLYRMNYKLDWGDMNEKRTTAIRRDFRGAG